MQVENEAELPRPAPTGSADLTVKLSDGLKQCQPELFVCQLKRAQVVTFHPRVPSPCTSTRTLQRQPWPVRSYLCSTGVPVVELHQQVVDQVRQGEGRLHQLT